MSKHPNPGHGPPSPTFSDATNASAMNFGSDGPEKIITRADLKASLQAYDDVRTRTLRLYLMSQITSVLIRVVCRSLLPALECLRELSFSPDVSVQGDLQFRGCHGSLCKVWTLLDFLLLRLRLRAPRECRLKGPSYETSTRIQGASGLHHLMGNQWHIMVRACTPGAFEF